MTKQSAGIAGDMVLADIPQRRRMRALHLELNALRDQIAALDLEIEILRDCLGRFEAQYHSHLRPEHQRMRQVRAWIDHAERWTDMLERAAAPAVQTQSLFDAAFSAQAERLQERRARELKQQKSAQQKATPPPPMPPSPPADVQERLKSAYRELARRFHPDLARTEDERLQHSQIMARINALYRAGDLQRLDAMREQARGAELDIADLTLEEQLQQLQERRGWFDLVHKNLQDERVALEQSAVCQLLRNVEQAQLAGRDLLDELKNELRDRIARQYTDMVHAAHILENAVSHHNRHLSKSAPGEALQVHFDPYEDKQLIRLGLEALAQRQTSPKARHLADRIGALAHDHPAVLRLLLFAYIAELSPLPMAGLEKYDDLQLRFASLAADDAAPTTLEKTLIDAEEWVEYGVRQATAKLAHVGLRLRQREGSEAVGVALQALPVRRAFKRVLGVLGEHSQCSGCAQQIFAVPLYRTRGLDDLRASVCPACGTTLRSYWMPRGKDVQAVLNSAFLDFEIVHEFSFGLGKASIAMQLVPQQLTSLTALDLKQRWVHDVFTRHEINITADMVALYQDDRRVTDKTPLERIDPRRFTVRFTADAELSENDALERVRHRIRHRFSQ